MVSPRHSWLRTLTDEQVPARRLVCFPHSGGTAESYAPWIPRIRPGTELLAVQYPGRADRFGEPPASGVREMSGRVADELAGLEPVPCVLFGHSLGALVAYETAVRLSAAGRAPESLTVSGSPPPRRAGTGRMHLASDADLWAQVCALGGMPPQVADDEELAGILLPALRADIAAHETYRPAPGTGPLTCPVRCYHGIGDPLVDDAHLPEWAEATTGPFTLTRRAGSHFHTFADPESLAQEIQEPVGT
ncbi:hypothetical protein BFF78_15635 [Streptomyces fodineus]|uniref:Thioesterase domain-containing protein n=1 Tax=Streptomyces fodineus TaxID=1904616 RepID=A0A1D7Y9K5_9ACTN|nr:alpha/beta fold hydrolase [Streptomyces fodineus]AOR32307.1 hypothetical protein BFF78_15635 [Streptomyces fodineus]